MGVVNSPLILLLILWSTVSTPTYAPTLSLTDSTYRTVALLPACSSDGLFFGVICGFLLVVLVFGLVLAFRTRHVPDQFAESRYVSMCIILVLFFAIMLVPLNFLLDAAQPAISTANTLMLIRAIGAVFAAGALGLTLFLPFFVQLSESDEASGGSSRGSKGAMRAAAGVRMNARDSGAYAPTSTVGNTLTQMHVPTTHAQNSSVGAVVLHVRKFEGGSAGPRSAAVAPARSSGDRKSSPLGSPSAAAVSSLFPRDRRSAAKQSWAAHAEVAVAAPPLHSGLQLRMSASATPPPQPSLLAQALSTPASMEAESDQLDYAHVSIAPIHAQAPSASVVLSPASARASGVTPEVDLHPHMAPAATGDGPLATV